MRRLKLAEKKVESRKTVQLFPNCTVFSCSAKSFRFGKKGWTGFDKTAKNGYNMQYC